MRADSLRMAATLLDKATATPFDAERHALALRAYALLAAYLNEAEAGTPAPRRRERRQLDRRRDGMPHVEPHVEPTDGAATAVPPAYRSAGAVPAGRRRRIDLTA